MASKWTCRLDLIRQMVADHKSDAEIGGLWEVTGATIYQVRQKYKIMRFHVRRKPTPARTPDTTTPLVGEPYVDAEGLTVTRYPARYAAGVEMQVITARPRR